MSSKNAIIFLFIIGLITLPWYLVYHYRTEKAPEVYTRVIKDTIVQVKLDTVFSKQYVVKPDSSISKTRFVFRDIQVKGTDTLVIVDTVYIKDQPYLVRSLDLISRDSIITITKDSLVIKNQLVTEHPQFRPLIMGSWSPVTQYAVGTGVSWGTLSVAGSISSNGYVGAYIQYVIR